MHRGRIDVDGLAGPFDLQATVESGQSYLWNRADGRDYEGETVYGGDEWYWTTVRVPTDREDPAETPPAAAGTPGGRIRADAGDPAVVRVRQVEGALEWESSVDAEPNLVRLLRLDDDLPAIRAASPDEPVVSDAYDAYWGMRLVRDPPFGSLVSFVCSSQMRVGRIHDMQRSLREAYGEPVRFDGRTYHAYPTPEALAGATEAELRDLGLGYRAPYVVETAEMVASGEADPADARAMEYEAAREYLTRFVGVGDKVADCVCLFSLGHLEAVPLDTWMRTTIADYFPDCDCGNYAETSRAIREALGGEYAGYAQTYVFHYLRNGGSSRAPEAGD